MSLNIKTADNKDLSFLTSSFLNTSTFLKETSPSIYTLGLPNSSTPELVQYVESFITDHKKIALTIENKACILGEITTSHFTPSNIGTVGSIVLCWVDQLYRKQGHAKCLTQKIEEWFLNHQVKTVELSYIATNSLAEASWSALGYQPFRVFSYKQLTLNP